MSFLIVLKNKYGEIKKVAPGEMYDGTEWRPNGQIENDGQPLSEIERSAQEMLAEIDRELGRDGHGPGDWIKTFARPVAALLGKEDCVSCEVRRTVINAAKKLSKKYGYEEGKRRVKGLLRRSFSEPPERILQELKVLLEM